MYGIFEILNRCALLVVKKMKVICAGLPKTGTKTMAKALRILGYDVHDYFEQYKLDQKLWEKVRQNKATLDDYREVLKDVDAVTDFPAYGFWEFIHEAFPEAKVILMERETEDAWLASLQNQFLRSEDILKRWMVPSSIRTLFYGPKLRHLQRYNDAFFPGCLGVIEFGPCYNNELLRSRYRQHNLYVKTVCPKEKLLIFEVRNGWKPLCEFLNQPVPDVPFPKENVKAEISKQISEGKFEDLGVSKGVRREFISRFIAVITVIVVIFSYVFYVSLNLIISWIS